MIQKYTEYNKDENEQEPVKENESDTTETEKTVTTQDMYADYITKNIKK
tara:strand:+ start:669 stop:815 length:147 start_codon:yes stop_codon:yes gene_type:complete